MRLLCSAHVLTPDLSRLEITVSTIEGCHSHHRHKLLLWCLHAVVGSSDESTARSTKLMLEFSVHIHKPCTLATLTLASAQNTVLQCWVHLKLLYIELPNGIVFSFLVFTVLPLTSLNSRS